jgi:hypothetical protein
MVNFIRLHGGTQAVLAQGFRRGIGNGPFQHLTDDRRAILLAQQWHRHLAGAEPGHLDGSGDLREARQNPPFDVISGDGDGELAAQAFTLGFMVMANSRLKPSLLVSSTCMGFSLNSLCSCMCTLEITPGSVNDVPNRSSRRLAGPGKSGAGVIRILRP